MVERQLHFRLPASNVAMQHGLFFSRLDGEPEQGAQEAARKDGAFPEPQIAGVNRHQSGPENCNHAHCAQ